MGADCCMTRAALLQAGAKGALDVAAAGQVAV